MKKIIVPIIIIVIIVIGILLYFIVTNSNQNNRKTNKSRETIIENQENSDRESEVETMQIKVSDKTNTIIYELNDSTAATELYNQLPLTTEVENFSSNEKIFYPPNELSTENTKRADSKGEGVLAYYAPWGDVVMFYDSFSSASGLYELGTVVEGSNQIRKLTGEITVEKIENKSLSINLIDERMLEKADYVGCVSGKKVDKSEVFDYEIGELRTPIITEAPVSIECRVEDIYETFGFENFILVLVHTFVSDKVLNEKKKIDYQKLKPVLFEFPTYQYLKTGEIIKPCMFTKNQTR